MTFPTSPQITVELVGSRRTKVSIEDPQQELLYIVSGSTDAPTIQAQLEAVLSNTVTITSLLFPGDVGYTAVFQNYEIEDQGNGIWKATVHYGKRQPRQTGDVVFSFDTTGGTQHIQVSQETQGIYTAPGVPLTSFQNSIGVNNDRVEGCDISSSVFKFTLAYYAPVSVMTSAYIKNLKSVGMNDFPWNLWDLHEVLYIGTTGQPRGYDDWELLFHFIMSENADALTVGQIENIVKDGWDYLWVRFQDSVNNGAAIKVPAIATVERVYDEIDFDDFGLPVWTTWQGLPGI